MSVKKEKKTKKTINSTCLFYYDFFLCFLPLTFNVFNILTSRGFYSLDVFFKYIFYCNQVRLKF